MDSFVNVVQFLGWEIRGLEFLKEGKNASLRVK